MDPLAVSPTLFEEAMVETETLITAGKLKQYSIVSIVSPTTLLEGLTMMVYPLSMVLGSFL